MKTYTQKYNYAKTYNYHSFNDSSAAVKTAPTHMHTPLTQSVMTVQV